jgi:hypothetical protein
MANRLGYMIALAGIWLVACQGDWEGAGAREEVYVGPYAMDLLAELSPKAEVVAKIHHGDKVRIVGRRRRFAKVRTEAGVEGWTDGQSLLTPEQMSRMRRLSLHAGGLPSHGKATVFGALNVHTGPHRQAPSFFQLQERDYVEVVSHRLEVRTAYQPPVEDGQVFPQVSWRLPADWVVPPEGADDWSLVRIPDGRAGWVLTRMLVMAIPDEVAQYAEGHRITSYFSLGVVRDGEQTKNHWLWTTAAAPLRPYEFDSFRVFVWNVRRHRYETAYIERNLVGHFPVEVEAGEGETARGPRRFSLLVRDKDDKIYRRRYAFAGYRVRLVEKVLWEPPRAQDEPLIVEHSPDAGECADGGALRGVRKKLKGWFE